MGLNFTQATAQNNYRPSNSYLPAHTRKRPFLPSKQFKRSHVPKRQWVAMMVSRHDLRNSEPKVLEALAFNTDPVNGIGIPAIGTIQERIEENDQGKVHYNTVRNAIIKLKALGIIRSIFRGRKLTNKYYLVDYKSEDCSSKIVSSLNSPLKEERENSDSHLSQSNINKGVTPFVGRPPKYLPQQKRNQRAIEEIKYEPKAKVAPEEENGSSAVPDYIKALLPKRKIYLR